MKTMSCLPAALTLAGVLATAALARSDQDVTQMPTLAELQKMTARYVPADIGADLSALPNNERDALARLIEASRIMDALFLRQVWARNDAMLQDLAGGGPPAGGARRARAA